MSKKTTQQKIDTADEAYQLLLDLSGKALHVDQELILKHRKVLNAVDEEILNKAEIKRKLEVARTKIFEAERILANLADTFMNIAICLEEQVED